MKKNIFLFFSVLVFIFSTSLFAEDKKLSQSYIEKSEQLYKLYFSPGNKLDDNNKLKNIAQVFAQYFNEKELDELLKLIQKEPLKKLHENQGDISRLLLIGNYAPRFSERDAMIDAIKGGINMFRANALALGTTPVVPVELDSISKYPSACSSSSPCFGNILQDEITNLYWRKASQNTYEWSRERWNSKTFCTAHTEMKCTYDNKTGSFVCKDK